MYKNEDILKKVQSLKKITGTGDQRKEIRSPENLIYLCYRGSIAHNMYIPSTDPNSVDDVDLLGVYLLPPNYYVGLSQHKLENPTTVEIMEPVDGVLLDCIFYELRHYTKMALRCNPNIFSALWAEPQHHILMTPAYKKIYDVKDLCLSRLQAYEAFTGYANGQLKRMTHFDHKGYMGEKRKALVSRFGYDTKNAAHLIRLLKMGIEVLETGKMQVYRTDDRDMLLAIKTGRWTLDNVKNYAEELFEKAKAAYEKSNLRETPERGAVEGVLEEAIVAYLCRGEI